MTFARFFSFFWGKTPTFTQNLRFFGVKLDFYSYFSLFWGNGRIISKGVRRVPFYFHRVILFR